MSGGGRGEVGVVGTTCMHAPNPEPWRGRLPPSTLRAPKLSFAAAISPLYVDPHSSNSLPSLLAKLGLI